MTNLDALIDVAEGRGYRVLWHRRGPKAAWLPRRHAVTLQVGMGDADTLCSLAHELGHAHYNDPPGHFGPHEIRADRFAAKLLVSPIDYAAAEALYGPHHTLLAHELGVTVKVLKTWTTLYERQTA
ncbi:ImmA/IrrE family metallo-endopeptidase [Corynebacterium flavescens]